MNKDNAKKIQPKGFTGFLFVLFSVIGAAAGVTYFCTTSAALSQIVLIAGVAASCLYALGGLVCLFCRRSGGTVLLTLAQVLASVLLAALTALAVMEYLAAYVPGAEGLGATVDLVRQTVGLSPRFAAEAAVETGEELAQTVTAAAADTPLFAISAAATALLALIHGLTSFSALSALKNFYKGKYKSGATGLFGFVSLLLAGAMGWLFWLTGWASPFADTLPQNVADFRAGSVVLGDTLAFETYGLSDWALLVWIASAVLSVFWLAFFAFRLAGKVSAAKRAAAFDTAFIAPDRAADEPAADIGDDLAAAATAGTAAAAAMAWDDDLTDDLQQADDTAAAADDFFTAPADTAAFAEPEEQYIPDDLPLPEPQAEPEPQVSQPVYIPEEPVRTMPASEPVYDDPYAEFSGVTAPAAAAAPRAIPGMKILDYGYSEDTII